MTRNLDVLSTKAKIRAWYEIVLGIRQTRPSSQGVFYQQNRPVASGPIDLLQQSTMSLGPKQRIGV